MNKENIKLTRTVIKELMEAGTVQEGTNVDVHTLYKSEHPNLEGDFLDMGDWMTNHECGTAACLAGWLAHDPRVQAAGLRLELELEKSIIPDDEDACGRLVPVYGEGPGRSKHMWALRRFLGFKEVKNAILVFGPNHPDTFASALERLDEAVAAERQLEAS